MTLRKINTVKFKLTISILLLTLVIVTFVGIYFPGRFKSEQLKALEDKAKITTSIIASNIASSIYFNDKDVLNEDLNRLISYNEIGFIVVKNHNQILYSYNLENAQSNHFEIRSEIKNINDDVYFKTLEKIMLGRGEVGALYIGFKLSDLHQELSEIRRNLFFINILILFFGVISSFTIGYYFTKPIHQLVEIAEQLKGGDFTVRAKIKRKDEIGFLASRFNNMIETISEFYVSLENKVASRTKELAEINTKLEHEILERTAAEIKIKHSLKEKEVLLKEIHHRVKNNLQIISSLLFLQSKNIKDDKSLSIFRDGQMRVRSIALVHEKLYQSNNLSQVDFTDYINNLASHIENTLKLPLKQITLIFELDKIFLTVDKAVPVGLILNELISNSFKHAFPENNGFGEKKNIIVIKFTVTQDKKLMLIVSDNGIGISESFDIETTDSMGLKIVSNLVLQIDGVMKIKNKDNTEFRIEFDLS